MLNAWRADKIGRGEKMGAARLSPGRAVLGANSGFSSNSLTTSKKNGRSPNVRAATFF
jgi:hypothetical protein